MTRFGRVLKLDFVEGYKPMLWGALCMMLLYLFSLKNHGQSRYQEDLKVAGVLYMPSDPAPKSGEKSASGIYTMKGLLVDDPKVLFAMEAGGKGIFIPKTIIKAGIGAGYQIAVILNVEVPFNGTCRKIPYL